MIFCNFSHKEHTSKLGSWWNNDLTHHVSIHQLLSESLLDKNWHGWQMALTVWSLYLHNAPSEIFLWYSFTRNETIQLPAVYNCNIDGIYDQWPTPPFPKNHCPQLDNAWSSRSTRPIPRLYTTIMAGCWIFCFPFPFIHLFPFPIGCTPYALLPIVTTELSLHLTISRLPSRLKSKDPLSFFYIFLSSTRGHFIILSFLTVPVALNPLVARSHINE